MRLFQRLQHMLERLIIRGAGSQLLVVASLIGLIALLAGVIVRAGSGDAGSLDEAVWWAFLHLTDPGYLGDNQGRSNASSPPSSPCSAMSSSWARSLRS